MSQVSKAKERNQMKIVKILADPLLEAQRKSK
jgi:hypothetical protein